MHSKRGDGRQDDVRTIVRDISWCGTCAGANACMVDVKDGKMLRIRPVRYYERYSKEEVKPWVMHARGQTFEPSEKTLIPPLSLLAQVEKADLEGLRGRYPGAFARECHVTAGPCLAGIVEGAGS